MAERYFKLAEAEELLPFVQQQLEKALIQKQAVDKLDEELSTAASRIMVLGGSVPPYGDLVKLKTKREETAALVADAVEEIQRNGCLVKDIDEGLVDFPSMREGREVYLCWKLGEERIAWWHGIEEGFAGRKPITEPPPDFPPNSTRLQ